MNTEHDSILPIDGRVFNTSRGTWTAAVSRWPIPPQNSTVLLYEVEFKGPSTRRLKLWVPGEIVVEKRQQEAFGDVQRWLEGKVGMENLGLVFREVRRWRRVRGARERFARCHPSVPCETEVSGSRLAP